VQRVEFAAGFRHIGQDLLIREYVYVSGSPTPVDYNEREENLPSYNLGEASAALVYDNAVFGYTSPFAGQRYRFEVAPTMGTLQFTSAVADFRKYFFLRPFSLAVRALHFGRYGRDEERLSPIFVGYPQLMRGYQYGSVSDACLEELRQSQNGGEECRAFEQLFGSRIGVANVELRFPLFRQIVLGNGFPLPPIEGIAFFDAGSAWGNLLQPDDDVLETRPVFRRGVSGNLEERGIFTSAGVGARINIFGYVILETVFVNAFDRPRGWHWEFALQPGF
jgi:outer membrane protein assembly factor BamA